MGVNSPDFVRHSAAKFIMDAAPCLARAERKTCNNGFTSPEKVKSFKIIIENETGTYEHYKNLHSSTNSTYPVSICSASRTFVL